MMTTPIAIGFSLEIPRRNGRYHPPAVLFAGRGEIFKISGKAKKKKCGLDLAAGENELMKKKKTKGRNSTKKPTPKSIDVGRSYYTARLRESYSQAAEQSLQICKEWERLDYELWAKRDQHEGP